MNTLRTISRRLIAFSLFAALLLPLFALAQSEPGDPQAQQTTVDPPGRVGRVARIEGQVSMYDAERGDWVDAVINRPLTSADRIATGSDGRVELWVGSTTLRLGAGSELEVRAIDDQQMSFELHSGSLALRVRSREVAPEIEIVTAEAGVRPLEAGQYRIDRTDDTSAASVWRGALRVEDGQLPFSVDAGGRTEFWRDGGRLLRRSTALASDEFSAWVLREDQREQRSTASQYVSPEMTGADDLDRYGRWEQSPDYGAVWTPYTVAPGWAPYRYGRWSWVAPWGWTWVDEAPWGFAPFHYGRWVHWGGRWGWAPGVYVSRPVWAPALVAWVGGGFSVAIGGPAIGWVPLAPFEWYRPYYRSSPGYWDRVNHRPDHDHDRGRPGRPDGHDRWDGRDRPGRTPQPDRWVGRDQAPSSYGNQGAPGGLTVVSREALLRREAVERQAVDVGPQGGRKLSVLERAPERPPERQRGAEARTPSRPLPPNRAQPQTGVPPAVQGPAQRPAQVQPRSQPLPQAQQPQEAQQPSRTETPQRRQPLPARTRPALREPAGPEQPVAPQQRQRNPESARPAPSLRAPAAPVPVERPQEAQPAPRVQPQPEPRQRMQPQEAPARVREQPRETNDHDRGGRRN